MDKNGEHTPERHLSPLFRRLLKLKVWLVDRFRIGERQMMLVWAALIGLLYLENNLATDAFTSERVTLLDLLASQAAISLENALLYEDLRRSEAYLADAQGLTHTGSWA